MLAATFAPTTRRCGVNSVLLRRRPPRTTDRPHSTANAAAAAAAAAAAQSVAAVACIPLTHRWAASAWTGGENSSRRRSMRLLHAAAAPPAVAGDRVGTVRIMEDPGELLQLAISSSFSHVPTLQQILKRLAVLSRDVNVAAALQQDSRMQQLLQGIGLRLQEADGRLLSQIASALALLRLNNLATQKLSMQLSKETVSRPNCLSPRSLCMLAASLASLRVQEPELQQFIWREAQHQMQQLHPADLCLLLEAVRRWGAYSRSSCDLLLQRMTEEIDSFTATDLVAAVDAMGSMGLARGFLLRQLSSLAFENLHHFSQHQLLLLMRGLGRLRFLTADNCDVLLRHFRIDCSTKQQQQQQEGEAASVWTPQRSAMLLGALALCDVGLSHQGSACILPALLQHVEGALDGGAPQGTPSSEARGANRLSLSSLVEAAYAICYFRVQERTQLLQRLLEDIYARPVSRDRILLQKLHEVQRAVDFEFKSCKAQPPLAWRAAFEDASRQAQDRLESSALHAEVALGLDLLRGGYRLQLQRNKECCGYRVDFFDPEARVCVEVDTVYRHAPCTMRHRHLESQGVFAVCIHYWQWRRCRSEEDQLLYLKQQLTPALEKAGRLQPSLSSFA
ncbi:hypothetical protein Emag_003065 [Eimeria magna]